MATINRVREKQKHSSMEQFNHEDRVYTVIGKRTKGICGKATFFIPPSNVLEIMFLVIFPIRSCFWWDAAASTSRWPPARWCSKVSSMIESVQSLLMIESYMFPCLEMIECQCLKHVVVTPSRVRCDSVVTLLWLRRDSVVTPLWLCRDFVVTLVVVFVFYFTPS